MKGMPDPESLLADSVWVRSLARHLVRDGHAADDIAQDALLSAVRHEPRQMRAWVRTAVRNLAVTTRRRSERRRQRERMAAPPESTASAAELVARAEAQRRVVAAVLALDDPYRTAVLLRYFDDLSPSEIARRTGEPAGTVRSRLKRALDMLRGRLDAAHGGDRGTWCAALLPLALVPHRALATGGAIVGAKSKAALLAALLILLLATAWTALELRGGSASPPRRGPALHAAAGATEAPEADADPLESAPAPQVVRRVGIDGIVVDQQGAGVPGAWIAIVRETTTRYGLADWSETLEFLRDPPAPVAEAWADEHGRFRLEIPVGSLDAIAATAPGYGVAQLTGLDLADGATGVILRLAPDALLRGRVENPAGVPIEGARVGLWSDAAPLERLAATTDASGRFEIAASAGQHVAAVDHPDYVDHPDHVGMVFCQVVLPADRVVFTLERGAALEGVVRHIETGEPLAGVDVAILYNGIKAAGPLPQRARTGTDGRFRFERLPTRGYLSIFVDGARHGRIAAQSFPWSERWKLEEILLGQGRSVTGRVVRRNGDAVEGVSGVRVLVLDHTTGFGRRGKQVTSGADGRFAANGIGTSARAMLDPRERRFAQVRSNEPMLVEVVDSVTVRGRVLDDGGAPVPGALVVVHQWSPGSLGSVFSGPGGAFVLRGAAPGAELEAAKDGYVAARGTASDGIELVLRRESRPTAAGVNSLWGTVVDRDGSPLLGVTVSVSGMSMIARRARYEFSGLEDEELEIVASRAGFKIARLSGVRARPGGVEMPPLVLEETPREEQDETRPSAGSLSIEGVVLDERGRPQVLAGLGHGRPGGETTWIRAGLNGRFRISGLAPGPYRLSASARSPCIVDPVVVDAGTKDLVLRPRLGATIEGRVVGVGPGELPFRVVALGKSGSEYGAVTDDKGRFVIEGLPVGRYTVTFTATGWLPDSLEGVEAGTKGLKLSAIRAVSIRGRVVTPDGSPRACFITVVGAAGDVAGDVRRDKSGGFEIRGLRPGREYTIRVDAKGKGVLRDVRAPATDIVITID